MQTNRKALFELRRVTAAFMAILVMLSANATALSAENNESTGKEEQTAETVTSPESETEETEGETTTPAGNKETATTIEADKDLKEPAGDEGKTDTEGNPADPESKEQTESSDTTEKLPAEEIVAEENTEVETAEFSLSEEESEEEDDSETESEEEPEALLLQSKVANTAALNASGTSGYVFKYSLDKTATDLNSEYETEVTLSLPSAEQKLESFVVFAIDKSSFSDGPQTIQNAIKLLDDIKESKANVKVNVVIFNRTGHPGEWLDVETQYDEIAKRLKEKQYSGGSNMHAGMLAAKEVLENVRDSQNNPVPDARKYLVLISDGSTYLHCKNNDYKVPFTRSYVPLEAANENPAYAYGGYWVEGYWNPYVKGADEAGNVRRPSTDNTDSWKKYLDDVAKRNNESNGDQYDFVWKYYDASTEEIIKGYIEEPREFRSASNIDISYLHCYNTWQELNKYNTYSIYVKDNGTTDQSSAIGFMRLLNGGKVAEFDKITDEILYYVSSGSKVEDYMGFKEGDYNFDLADPASMKIEIEQGEGDQKVSNTYTAEKISENKFGFCPNGNGYDFEVEYVPAGKGAKEHFVWYINRNISNFERINLIYKEVLNNPKTVSGTYNVDTNQSATLYPKDSHGNTPNPDHEDFPKPTVSYTVNSSTPSTPTPTPTPRPTSEPTPTSTPTPTYIPVPTIVPTEPTPTPVVPPVVPQQGGNPRPRVVPANQPTPTPTASATPTPRPTPSATPTPTPAVIEEPEVPLARPGAWALINLICSILTCITGLGMGITYLRKHDEAIDEEEEEIRRAYVGDDEKEEEVNKRKASKFTGIIPAVGSVILFCLTEDMRLPMRLVDKWTIWMVVILLVNLLLAYLTRNRNNEKLYFNANGGVGYMEPVIQEAGKDAEVPEGEFVRSGYTFAGWNTEPDGSGDFYQPSDSFRMEKDQVNKLYAQWKA